MTDSHFVACIIHSPCHKTRRYIKKKVWGGTVIKKALCTVGNWEAVGGRWRLELKDNETQCRFSAYPSMSACIDISL